MMALGPRAEPEEAARNQRERLFGSMVVCCAERGFETTTVSELVAVSGVSRRDFYRHFADKKACFLATLEAIAAGAATYMAKRAEDPARWEERSRRDVDDMAKMVIAQPMAARLFLFDAYAAGTEAVSQLQRGVEAFETITATMLAQSPERAGMPTEMIRAYVGAMQEITRTRLRRGSEAELPKLMDALWALIASYRPPPIPLRRPERLPRARPENLEGHDHAERALRAFAAVVADRGYSKATINEVVQRAQMSASTFYERFSSKEDAMSATLDSGGAQLVAAVIPAARREPDWAAGIRAGIAALYSYLAFRPAMAQLLAVEVYAAGPNALERRAKAINPLEELLAEGYRLSPSTPPIAVEVIVGGISALAYRQIRDSGPQSLPILAPICTYMALAPFIGAEKACVVANGEGQAGRTAPTWMR